LLSELIVETENACPQCSSVTRLTLWVDTPWIYISANVDTSAFSLRW
jgi:hypothetical protein